MVMTTSAAQQPVIVICISDFFRKKIIRAFDRSKRNLSFFVKMNVEQFEHVKFSVTRLGYFLTKIAQINAIWYTLKTALFK